MKVKLSDLYDIGSSKRVFQSEWREEGIPFYRAREIAKLSVDGYVDNELFIDEELYSEYVQRYGKPEAGDIMVTGVGTLGVCYVVKLEDKFYFKDGNILWFKQKAHDRILPEYLINAFNSKEVKEFIAKNSSGTTVGTFTIQTAKKLEISLPMIEEQKKIINKISSIERILKQRKNELELLDNLIKSRFVEMFGEEGTVVPLTDYVYFQEGPGVRSVDFVDEGEILLTGSNINDNEISFGYKSDRYISSELFNGKYAHFVCDKDDILVVSSAIAPEKFDKKVVVVNEDKKYCLNTGIIRFKPNKKYMTIGYFREFLKSDYFKHQVMSEMRGIAQMHFGPSHLKDMTILLPSSLDKQVEFETFVNQVDKLKFEVQKSLDETQTLMDSLMQQYFG